MSEKKRILVVDDESPIADMIADFCQSFGFDTKVLNGGEDIVEVVKAYKPHLITLDIIMPEVSGIEILELLRQDDETKSVPVVIISSIAGNLSVAEVLRDQTKEILGKPIQFKKLKETIDNALAGAKH